MVELDEIIRVGATTVAALVQRMTRSDSSHASWTHAEKRPVAVLIRSNDVTVAFEVDGTQIALDEFEQRFPGRCAEFERISIANRANARRPGPADLPG